MLPRFQFVANLVVVAQKPHFHRVVQVEKQEVAVSVAAALKQVFPQLADADAAVDMRPAKGFGQVQQRRLSLIPLSPRQVGQPAENRRLNDEELYREFFSGRPRSAAQASSRP